jgi:hypothetical protein
MLTFKAYIVDNFYTDVATDAKIGMTFGFLFLKVLRLLRRTLIGRATRKNPVDMLLVIHVFNAQPGLTSDPNSCGW